MSKINSTINKFSSNILNSYETIFLQLKKKPVLGVIILTSYLYLYLSQSQTVKLKPVAQDFYTSNEEQETISKLREDLERISLSSGFEKINFSEEWKDDNTKEKVSRLSSYAEELKNIGDLTEAEKLYLEANKIQITKTAFYNLGSIYFANQEYNKSIEALNKIKEIDEKEDHPEVDLYIGLSHQRLNNTLETKKYINEYLVNINK